MAAESVSDEGRDDFGPVLHEEVYRLPERYRAVIVLCCLEGLTHEQAARQLGWPIGTVQSRLSRGRERLRGPLIRRGLAPGVVIPTLASPTSGVLPAIPPALADCTIRGATQLAITGASAALSGLFPGSVATLTEGVLRTMILTKLKIAAFGLLSTCVLVTGAGILAGQEPAAKPAGPRPPGAAKAGETVTPDQASGTTAPEEGSEEALKRRLVEIARRRLEAQEAFYKEGRITVDRYMNASNQLMLAEIQASKTREVRIAAALHLDRARAIEDNERSDFQVGRGTIADVTEAEQHRLQAELDLKTAENPTGRHELEVLQDRVSAVERKLDLLIKALEGMNRLRD